MPKNILDDLQDLEKAGIISADIADKIENYYRQKERAQPGGRINIVFAILGTLLVSLGIILIIAHNWDDLSRSLKLCISFIPVLIGQFLCGYTLYKKPANFVWKESSATFLFFAVGACLALVSQTYHIPGSVTDFVFTWMLLVFPLIYIMRSSIASLLFIAGITFYAVKDGYGYNSMVSYRYWWMLLLMMPHYLALFKNRPQSNFTYFHHWFIPVSLTICLGTVAANADEWLSVAYMSMFGFFYLLGTSDFFYNKRIFGNGYIVIGSLGTICLLMTASFEWFWTELSRGDIQETLFSPELIAALIFSLLGVVMLWAHIRNRKGRPVNWMGSVFLGFIFIFFLGISNPWAAAVAANLLVLAAALFTINRGNQLNHLGILNYGLIIIALLVICRFFDTHISFFIRGLMFMGVGAGFFIANNRLLKKRKQHDA